MKRKYIFNWEVKQINDKDINNVSCYEIVLHNNLRYVTSDYEQNDLYISFQVQPENIIEDIETVIINE